MCVQLLIHHVAVGQPGFGVDRIALLKVTLLLVLLLDDLEQIVDLGGQRCVVAPNPGDFRAESGQFLLQALDVGAAIRFVRSL